MSVVPRESNLNDSGSRPPSAGPLVVVLAGQERFVSGLASGSFARVTVGRFPNGELHAVAPVGVSGRRCVLVGSISPPAGNLERFTLVAHALRRAGARRITALLPYLAYARQDRASHRESLGLEWVGGLLRASGISEVVCVDVHSTDAADLLSLPLSSLSPAELLAAALPEPWRDGVTFVAPDEGAVERCAALARAVGVDRPVVWARKRRRRSGVEHLGLVGSPGPRAVAVDDILDTGATLISFSEALRAAGVRELGVVATHGLFSGELWRLLLSNGVRELWITDTVLSGRRPAEAHVVPVAPQLAPVLERRIE
jgi:ribose-phosphate pyrophosphokinase